ncbi:hypothetical protein D031_1771B, partial [Vibrio parahaemolyticus VP-48]
FITTNASFSPVLF